MPETPTIQLTGARARDRVGRVPTPVDSGVGLPLCFLVLFASSQTRATRAATILRRERIAATWAGSVRSRSGSSDTGPPRREGDTSRIIEFLFAKASAQPSCR